MTRTLLILIILSIYACSDTNKSKTYSKVESIEINDTSSIIKLLNNNSTYLSHYFIDFNNDSISELILISKSNENSECLSLCEECDTLCVYVDLDFHKSENNKWKLFKEYQFEDSKNTIIKIDSTSKLIITKTSKPSGLSNESKTETYYLIDGEFYLSELKLNVDTKINSAYGSDKNIWKYFIDFKSSQLSLQYSELRTIEDIDGNFILSDSEKTLSKELKKTMPIKLGNKYNIDSLMIDGYEIFY